jgi:hypothetical protein
MPEKYVRAVIGLTRGDEECLELQRGTLQDGRGIWSFVALMLRIPEGEGWSGPTWRLCRALEASEPYSRPRTLRRRVRVANTVRRLAGELGWQLTPEEEEAIEQMAQDRTIDTSSCSTSTAEPAIVGLASH